MSGYSIDQGKQPMLQTLQTLFEQIFLKYQYNFRYGTQRPIWADRIVTDGELKWLPKEKRPAAQKFPAKISKYWPIL